MNNNPDVKSEFHLDPITGQRSLMTRSLSIGSEGGQGFNRELSAAQITTLTTSAVVKFEWAEGSRPKSIEVNPIDGACWVCFDAPDAATALAWCQGASGEAVDSQRYLCKEVAPEGAANGEPAMFEFTDGLSNMYILEYATALTALTVEAS